MLIYLSPLINTSFKIFSILNSFLKSKISNWSFRAEEVNNKREGEQRFKVQKHANIFTYKYAEI